MFKWLRILVLLRRIAVALERQNELNEQRFAIEHPQWAKDHNIKRARPVLRVELSRATADSINERYREQHPFDTEE